MSYKLDQIGKYANILRTAEHTNQGMEIPISQQWIDMNVDDAYAIQIMNIEEKIKNNDYVTGKKIGLTSKAMQEMMGVSEPDYGHLLSSMEMQKGQDIKMSQILQPKVEAEVAFILKEDLIGPKVSVIDVMLATDYVVPSLEIVGSRIKDWKINLLDTVADNASSGLYVLGEKKFNLGEIDLVQMGMVLYKNGEIVNTGVGSAALGNPAICVAWLANKLYKYGVILKKGEVILSGALSAAVNVEAGDEIKARFSNLGEVDCKFIL